MSGEFGDINCHSNFVHDAHSKVSEELQGYGNDRPRYRTTQLVGAFMNKALYSLVRRVAYDESADSEPRLPDYNHLLDRVEGELAALRNGIEKALSGDNLAIDVEDTDAE